MYERAVASLAAGQSEATVAAGYKTLVAAGPKAFPMLISNLKDTAKAFPSFVEERVDEFGNLEEPTIGDVCFRLMRYEVEGVCPKGFRDYQVLTEENVANWWETHRTKSLREMRIETARISLERVTKEFGRERSEVTQGAFRFFTERLEKVERE
jgi:hypothetical protein